MTKVLLTFTDSDYINHFYDICKMFSYKILEKPKTKEEVLFVFTTLLVSFDNIYSFNKCDDSYILKKFTINNIYFNDEVDLFYSTNKISYDIMIYLYFPEFSDPYFIIG